MEMPWLRLLVSGLSPRKYKFNPCSVPSQYMWDEVEYGNDLFPSICVYPCYCHSTIGPYSFIYCRYSIIKQVTASLHESLLKTLITGLRLSFASESEFYGFSRVPRIG
jgi:hypothetical protein